MRNRNGLDVLIHALSGDPARDHGTDALWLGTPVPLRPHVHRPRHRPELLPSA
jgi:aromatic ring-cleaving dioxygenase